jgi:hypothetical protein
VTGFFARIFEAFERQKGEQDEPKMARMQNGGVEQEWGIEDMT